MNEEIYLATKAFPDGRIGTVMPLTYGRARLTIGRDWTGYDRGY